jgi:hypothetical protein
VILTLASNYNLEEPMGVLSFLKKMFGRESVAEHSREAELLMEQEIEIDFPEQHQEDETGINFSASINGRRVSCKIIHEALQDRFHFRDEDFLNCYLVNRT